MRKKLLCLGLALCLLLTGCGVSGKTEPVEQKAAPEVRSTEITEPETTEPAQTEPAGILFLTVSEIDLTLVGDSENIYAGTIPADQVTWTSEDESVIQVRDGVIRAVGTGSTTVTASAAGQQVSCRAGCLAEDRESLLSLGEQVYRRPKRLPPVLPEDCRFYENAALLGDSIGYGLFKNETLSGGLGHPVFLVRGGVSIIGLVKNVKNVIYQGQELPIADAIAASGVDRVFILLGQNDLDFMEPEEVLEYLKTMVEMIRKKNPQVILVIQSCIPKYNEDIRFSERNERVRFYNTLVEPYAAEAGLQYMELAPYVEDHVCSMAKIYCLDELHLNPEGCRIWMEVLKAYTLVQEAQ